MLPKAPKPTSTSDTRQTPTETIGPKRARREGGRTDPSRTAAIGGTPVARKAGRSAASSVTTVPRTIETITVRVAKTRPVCGRSAPNALKSSSRPFARPKPTNRPTIDARIPVVRPSRTTIQSTCQREAPTVRSVANSRVRWAIVIESVLAITNAPTKSAMPPNASRK